jgi:hypothetical protein
MLDSPIRSGSTTSGVRRLALVAASARQLVAAHGTLIAEATRRRHRVLCLAPDFDAAGQAALRHLAAEAQTYPLARGRSGLLSDFTTRRVLQGHLRTFAPHAVALFGSRALMYAAPVAARLGARTIVAVHDEPEVAAAGAPAGVAAPRALTKALALATTVVVHSAHQARRLSESGWLAPGTPVKVVAPAAIDLSCRPELPMPPLTGGMAFLVLLPGSQAAAAIVRMAIARLKTSDPQARFIVVESGGDENGAAPAGPEAGWQLASAGAGAAAARLAQAHVVVAAPGATGALPEVLEALAAGRPVIVAEGAAMRKAVDERVNGCYAAFDDADAIAAAMGSFLARPDLIPAMGRASRLKAERRFDIAHVDVALLDALGLPPLMAAAA